MSVNQFQLLLNGLAGQNYALQATTNLGRTNWLLVLFTNAPCDTIYLTDPDATNSERFYRVEQMP